MIFELNTLTMKITPSFVLIVLLFCLGHSRIITHQTAPPSVDHSQMVNVNELTSISNLEANNWILGSISRDEYYAKRFAITKKYNTSLCPLDKPYVLAGSIDCAQCPPNAPIFVLENDTCVACPTGETYSQTTNQCVNKDQPAPIPPSPSTTPSNAALADTTKFVNITNLDANNWVLGNLTLDQYHQKRFLLTKTQNTSLCPVGAPYVLKGKTACEQCPSSTPIFSL